MTQPVLPLTYPDCVWTDDMDPMARETTSDLQNLQQDVMHLLIEDLGSNLDDLARGIGVDSALSGPSAVAAAMASRIDQQLGQDDRIDSSHTTVTQQGVPGTQGGATFAIEIEIVVSGTTLGLSFAYSATGGLQIP